MSDRYPGGFLTNATPTVSTSSATGIWTPEQQLGYQAQGQWPSPPPPAVQVDRSLRFNSADSAYLSRTPGSASNRTVWTWSGWFKKCGNAAYQHLFAVRADTNNYSAIDITSGDVISVYNYRSGSYTTQVATNGVLRDPSAWYHIVVTSNSSTSLQIYINGAAASQTTTTGPGSTDWMFNSTTQHEIGRWPTGAEYLNGYLTNIDFIDGQALDPSYFGQYNATTGVWEPIQTVGYLTYGTNGFHLDFADNTSTTTIGYDTSGNGNNWTANNFSVTAGVGNDSLVDTPTPYGTDTGAGGEVGGNYCTINSLLKGSLTTISNGNLASNANDSSWNSVLGTFLIPTSGKWYWEFTPGDSNGFPGIIVATENFGTAIATYPCNGTEAYAYYGTSGNKYSGPVYTSAAYGASFGTSDVVGIAFDADSGTLTFYKNGTSQGVAFSGLTKQYIPLLGVYSSNPQYLNFGQRAFAYTAPSGHKALCTTNLPEPDVVQGDTAFNTVLYTGNSTQRAITGVNFQPDFVWIKSRSYTYWHQLFDVNRGPNKALYSNATDAEFTDTDALLSFDSDGFTIGPEGGINDNTRTYVAWNWKAGGSGVSNTDGAITSTVSANQTAGVSVVTYTGGGTFSATVGHGLGAAPKIVIAKGRSSSDNWIVYTDVIDGSQDYLALNLTDAKTNSSASAPTSTVFNPYYNLQNTTTYVAYCFAPVEGFSAFGSYTGNGSTNGQFVYTGFRPAFVIYKRTDLANSWAMWDSTRNTYNTVDKYLLPYDASAEGTAAYLDFTSNGFKLRTTATAANASGGTYLYIAFAENPFKYSLAR